MHRSAKFCTQMTSANGPLGWNAHCRLMESQVGPLGMGRDDQAGGLLGARAQRKASRRAVCGNQRSAFWQCLPVSWRACSPSAPDVMPQLSHPPVPLVLHRMSQSCTPNGSAGLLICNLSSAIAQLRFKSPAWHSRACRSGRWCSVARQLFWTAIRRS